MKLFFASALLLLGGCASNRDVCTDLGNDLRRCGLPATSLDCTTAGSAAIETLASQFDAKGCDGAKADDGTDAVDPRLCAAAGWKCPSSPTPAPTDAKAKYPVVFVAGIDASPIFDWNPRIVSAVDGAIHVPVTPWATTPDRAADLWASLSDLRTRLGTKLNLVCYAVAGLDCRYVASPNGLFAGDAKSYADVADTIASITTVSTPHRGTRVADAALAALDSGTATDILAALIGSDAASSLATSGPSEGALQKTLEGLTIDASVPFNAAITDGDGIYYQSWAGVSHVLGRSSAASDAQVEEHCGQIFQSAGNYDAMNELLFITAPWSSTSRADDGTVVSSPSDGMIAVESAKWGTFRGCIPADHYDVIGQIGHTTRDGQSGFDAPAFYRFIASDLAARGF